MTESAANVRLQGSLRNNSLRNGPIRNAAARPACRIRRWWRNSNWAAAAPLVVRIAVTRSPTLHSTSYHPRLQSPRPPQDARYVKRYTAFSADEPSSDKQMLHVEPNQRVKTRVVSRGGHSSSSPPLLYGKRWSSSRVNNLTDGCLLID